MVVTHRCQLWKNIMGCLYPLPTPFQEWWLLRMQASSPNQLGGLGSAVSSSSGAPADIEFGAFQPKLVNF